MLADSSSKVKPLSSLKKGTEATITSIAGDGAIRQRILDMGLTRGAKVRIIKLAPLGDPMEVGVRGFTLSLRKSEADIISVQA